MIKFLLAGPRNSAQYFWDQKFNGFPRRVATRLLSLSFRVAESHTGLCAEVCALSCTFVNVHMKSGSS